MPFWKTTVCTFSAGGIAAVVGNPADLSFVRMQEDTMLPEAERSNYWGVVHAFSSIMRDEGFDGFFKGAVPTATRAMALNFGMLGFNTMAKAALADMGFQKDGAAQVFEASAVAGFFASFFSLPFGVKTQIQKMKPDPPSNHDRRATAIALMMVSRERIRVRWPAGARRTSQL